MSRIGKKPVSIPKGVSVEKKGSEIHVKGPKGRLSSAFPEVITAEIGDGVVLMKRSDDKKPTRALHGLARANLANMVTGVTEGFQKTLSIEGVGYRAEVSGRKLVLAVGFSYPVEIAIPEGLDVSVERNTEIRVTGVDRQMVGQFSADIRKVRPPEPYKGKGIRYSDERVRRKVGKTGAV